MAVLPPATISPRLDEAVNRLPFLSNEAVCSRILRNQRVPVPPSKQTASCGICERSVAWRVSAMAASAPQTRMPVRVDEEETDRVDEAYDQDEAAAAEGSLLDWNSQWYPVSLTDDLDKRVPTAITIMGRHLVASWGTEGSWQVCDETGSEVTPSIAYAHLSGVRDAQSSPVRGSLKRRSQSGHASVYPSVDQDGLLWFWPDTRPEFKSIAERKPPPSIPALTDPAFKDKLYTMNLPYGYKKMIENFLEPACLPFAHEEPEVDFFEEFEESLTSTASQLLNKPISGHAYHAKLKAVPSNSNGRALEGRKFTSLGGKLVMNGNSIANLDASVENCAPREGTTFNGTAKGSCNTLVEAKGLELSDEAPGSSNGVHGGIKGSPIMEDTFHEAKHSNRLHRSTDLLCRTGSRASKATGDTLETTASVRSGDGSAELPNAHAALQTGEPRGNYEIISNESPLKWAGGDGWHQNMAEEGVEGRMINESSDDEGRERKVQSSVVIKKPSSSSRSKFAEKINATMDHSDDFSMNTSESVMNDSSNVSPLDLESSLRALRRLIFRKDYEPAKRRVIELYRKYPRDSGVLMEYAFLEKQFGDLVAAGSLYSKAISVFEDQQNLGYDYVRALQALGSIEARAHNVKRSRVLFMESIRAARQTEQRFPDLDAGASVYALHAWAKLELQQGNWAKARDLLTRAADIQPGNAVVHQSRALLEARAHNWTEARHHFSRAVESAPRDIKCWHAWAIFEARQRKVDKMRDLFQKALEVDPDSIHCLQAWAHQETLIATPESYDKARCLLQRCIQIDRRSLYAWQAWAVLEKNARNYEKARELFEKSLEINPSSVACLQALANMERYLKNWGAAQKLLRKALKLEPENAAVLMEAAFVENSLGNIEVAERLFALAGMADKKKSRVRNRIFASRKEVMPSRAYRGRRGFKRGSLKRRTKLKSADKVSTVDQGTDRLSIAERKPSLFEARGGAIDNKQEEHDSHSVKQRLSSSHVEHRGDNDDTNFPVVSGANKACEQTESTKNLGEGRLPSLHVKQKKRASTNFQIAIDAIQSRRRPNSGGDGQPHSRTNQKQKAKTFQFAIDAIKAKQREVKSTEGEHTHCIIDGEKDHSPDGISRGKALETEQIKPMLVEDMKVQPSFAPKQAERVLSMMGA